MGLDGLAGVASACAIDNDAQVQLRRNSRWTLGLVLLAPGLRVCRLGDQSLWFDETFSMNERDIRI